MSPLEPSDLRTPPASGDFAPGYAPYLARVSDPWGQLQDQAPRLAQAVGAMSPDQETHRYAPEKWSVREVLGHIVEVERVMAYRLLRAARGDATPLPAFDENAWVETAGHDRRSAEAHFRDFLAARTNTLSLLDALDVDALKRRVEASGQEVTVRSLLWILAGHPEHHMAILEERYGVPFPPVPSQIGE
jgi:uncharacterized damage-inducible protein DinB